MTSGGAAQACDVIAVGRSSLDLYAHQIGCAMADVRSFDAYLGGCPTNVSVGTRRLGLKSVLLTAVGDDQVGDFIVASLDREGVDTRFIPRKPGRRTSAVVLTIQPPDRFPLTFYRDNCADRALTPDDVARVPIAASRVVFVTGTGLSHEPGREATRAAAETARAARVPVVAGIHSRPDQWESAAAFAAQVQALLQTATLAVGTEEEITAATGMAATCDGVAALLSTGIAALVVKRGARGATIFRGGSPPADVAPFAVDV